MLPAEHRLRDSSDFAHVIRRGRRAGRPTLVVHVVRPVPRPARSGGACSAGEDVRVGLVVGKSVGNSVIRHRVSRRLRAQLADRIATIPGPLDVVIRAQPAAAVAESAVLGLDLDAALARLLRRPGVAC